MSRTTTPPDSDTAANESVVTPAPPSAVLTGLVSQRWRVVDRFDRDGKRYVLACCDDEPAAGLARLTPREREVVAYASRGFANKVIAYEMAVSASTVGVLLYRASKKLGTTTRRELVALCASQPAVTLGAKPHAAHG
jgi:DNA-binding NarL/FixJ family response regulator